MTLPALTRKALAAVPSASRSRSQCIPACRRTYAQRPQRPVPNPPPTTALPDEPSAAAKAAATAKEGVSQAAEAVKPSATTKAAASAASTAAKSPVARSAAASAASAAVTPSSSSSSSSKRRGAGPFAKFVSFSLFLFGSTFLVTYYLDSRSAIHRWVAMPFLHSFVDAEEAQKLAIQLLKTGLAPKDYTGEDDALRTELFGQPLVNPIGLAAGFDKQAEAIDGLFDLGFGIVEVGSVTPQPQPGNPKPRYFRIPSHSASINRFGFNSDGHAVVLERLLARVRDHLIKHPDLIPSNFLPDPRSPDADPRLSRHQAIELAAIKLTQSPATVAALLDHHSIPRSLRPGRLLSINLGKNKTSAEDDPSDFVRGVETFGPLADVLVVNVSSPNTPGLRDLQKKESLQKLLCTLVEARDALPARLSSSVKRVPLVVKIAPDLTPRELDDVASVIIDAGIDGVIISNTTIQRPQSIAASLPAKELPTFGETGGLSGPPLRPIARQALQQIVGRLRSADKEVIAAGGISSPEDVLEATRDGASAVQVYTAFGWQGVGMVSRWKDELRGMMGGEADEHSSTWRLLSRDSRVALLKAEEERKRVAKESFEAESQRVRGELEDLKRRLGGDGDESDSNTFWPDEDDAAYNDLLTRTRSALGLSQPSRPSPSTRLRHTETPPTMTLQSSGSSSSSSVEDRDRPADRTMVVVASSPVEVTVDPVNVYGKSEAEKAKDELQRRGGASSQLRGKVFDGIDRARKV